MDKFSTALALLLSVEGGVSTSRTDLASSAVAVGKAHTNLGITLKTVRQYDADGELPGWLRLKLDVNADGVLDEKDVVGWTPEIAADFYRIFYWEAAKCDVIPWPLSGLVFDMAVNSGKPRAILLLQRSLGVRQDGLFGSETLGAISRLGNQRPLLVEFTAQRLDFYRKLDPATVEANFLGWSRRSVDRLAYSLSEVE